MPMALAIALATTVLMGISTSAATSDNETGDRATLIALYEATDGQNWRHQDAWLTDEPLDSWHGVSLADGRVTQLDLSNNRLNGRLPSEVGMLTELRRLELPGNHLHGNVPDAIGDLAALTHLDLRWNSLDGHVPPSLANLTRLASLLLSANRLTGPIPPDLGRLVYLTRLDLSHNELSGEIPPTLGLLSHLNALGLRGNRLRGPLPPQLAGMSKLNRLYLDNNELSGEIPAEFGGLSELTHLDLSSNALVGRIPPQLGNLGNLVWLGLGHNLFAGEIPAQLGNLSNLLHLDLRAREHWALVDHDVGTKARLSGSLPVELAALTHLEYLDIRGNELDGELPDGAGVLSDRLVIHLDSEQCESKLRGVESMTFEYVCGEDESQRPMRATVSLAATTADVPDNEFGRMAVEAMAAIIVRDGYALLDTERIPGWLDPNQAVAMVERFNAHLRDADIAVHTPDDLLRAFETYGGEMLDISVPQTIPGLPESATPRSILTEGDTQPSTTQQVQFPSEAKNTSPAHAVVARHFCDVDANAPSRIDQRVVGTADGSCYTVFTNPEVLPPPPTWDLILALQRQEGFWLWGGWVLIGSAQHRRWVTYVPDWDDVDVPSNWCPNGNNRTWGGIIFHVPPPYVARGNPIPVFPVTADIEGCKWRPGDCKFAQHDSLSAAVDANCKTPRPTRCTIGPQDCDTFREKYAHYGRCLSARRTRESTCFDGGDDDHKAQITQLENAQGNCKTWFERKRCAGTID